MVRKVLGELGDIRWRPRCVPEAQSWNEREIKVLLTTDRKQDRVLRMIPIKETPNRCQLVFSHK
jgi:hypothetical protein